jgi:ribosomal protein S18 acetylase RimI-like enzyme
MREVSIRRAETRDTGFVVEAIIAAEKSGSGPLSYAAIFDLDEGEMARLLWQALEEDLEGQEVCLSHFLIAELDGVPAAGCASWIEARDGIPSGQIKANLLFHLVGQNVWKRAADRLKAVAETSIQRSVGAAQLESIYTKPDFRGNGLAPQLIEEHLKAHRALNPEVERAQLILFKNNARAAHVYRKIGFEQIAERSGTHPLLDSILSCPAKIMMEKQL